MLQFNRASKKSARLRLALIGAAGAGKTYTALSIASHLEGPVAVIDTERGSASKYSDSFEFDVLELETHSPQMYIDAIRAAEEAGYKTLIIDSLSHAWTGKEGALDQVDRVAKRSQSGNTFGAWRDVTPMHNAMVDAIIVARMHIITTMRAKTEYVQEKNEKTGRTTVRKVGMAPVQRDGLEYEFDVVADLDQDNNMIIGKTRCPALQGAVFAKAGREVAAKLSTWLTDGTPEQSRPQFGNSNGAVSTGVVSNGAANGKTYEPLREVAPAPRAEARSEAKPAKARAEKVAPVATVEDDDIFADGADDLVLCRCGVEAKYVRGKSGAGWVCGHQGTDEPGCSFRMRDAGASTVDAAPAAPAEYNPLAEDVAPADGYAHAA
jgi:hypothetical protein